MESDDDFLPPTQFTLYRGANRQAVSSTSRPLARDRPGPSQPRRSSQSHGQPSQSEELSQIQDGLKFLMDRVQQLSADSRGIKRPGPGEQKPLDKRPDTKEQCQLCKKFYANKTTLFRHYYAMHKEMNPEKYHGCSVNSTVVSLDVSLSNTCGVCGYVAASQNALDAHNRDVHSNGVNANPNNANTIAVHTIASNSSNDALNRTDESVANKENISNNAVINKFHKCEKCVCYFEERNKLDEHMKIQHGFEVVCKICNKNLLFKDIDGHVKDSHPDVYKKNKEKNEKVIIEKVMKNKKGNRVHIFVCTKCDLKMVDKMEADKHARGHMKRLKIKVAPRSKVSKAEDHFTDVTLNDHVILTCNDCDVSTGSYDAAVEHAQNHITNNSNDIVTQQCLICELKFEPLCYKKHIDLHYKNKEIHKESFKYFKYRYQTLLTENWFYCFSTAIPELKKMIDESIYEHARSVKMRVTQGGTYNVYKCCQCDNFVDPAAVLNHTLNYDTCVKVKNSYTIYTCDICDRKFNNKLAKNNHVKDHKCEDNYRTVLFNHENDKEFNKILNDPNIRLNNDGQNSEEVIKNTDAHTTKVLYKCLCGLCFVRKENADAHKKICPGKDPKKTCPKCNNLFNPEELLAHCFEHHLNQIKIVIEHISPDVIVIESDEESENNIDNNIDIIEIVTSDEEDAETERFDNIQIEVLKPSDAETISEDDAEKQNMNASNAIIKAGNVERVATEPNLLIEKSEQDIDDDEDRCDIDFGGPDEMTDDDCQDTITCENTETATAIANPAVNIQDKVKCVPINLLLNPLHFETNAEDRMNVLNAEIAVSIESIRQQLTTTDALCTVLDATIKKENSWFDPTDFSNIRSRRSLRQTEMQLSSINFSQEIVELLLTDDEETEMNDENDTEINENIRSDEINDILNEGTGNNDMSEDPSISNTHTEQAQNRGTVVNMNDISHALINEHITAITQNEVNNVEESVKENNVNCESQPELAEINGQEGTNYPTHSSHEEPENNANIDQDYSDIDDDLFLPSGIENREMSFNTELNNNEKVSKGPLSSREDQVAALVNSANNESVTSDTIEASGSIYFEISVHNTSKFVENTQDDAETNNIRSDDTNDINPRSNETEIDKEVNSSDENNGILNTNANQLEIDVENATTQHFQPNYDEDTQDFVEPTPNEASTVINNVAEPEAILREEISIKPTDVNIKKEFGYMNINVKRELVEENVQENENGCDREVRIKTEPIEYNGNKENDIFFIKNSDNVNHNHCSIC